MTAPKYSWWNLKAKARKGFRYGNYSTGKNEDIPARRPVMDKPDEGLTGIVRGQPASDLEERLARAFYRLKIPFAPLLGSVTPVHPALRADCP